MNKKNNGITLIALVITIIVMLILVAETISMAVNGGLFGYAGKATGDTQNAINLEQEIANGEITVGESVYDSIGDYIASAINDYVAKIESTYYKTLQEAFNAVPADGSQTTVELLKDVSENVLVEENKNIILEMKGNTVTNVEGTAVAGDWDQAAFEVYGNLEVENGTIVAVYGCAIENYGTANITGGDLYGGENSYYSAIYNLGEMTINGANVYGLAGAMIENYGTMFIKGTELDGISEVFCGLADVTNYGYLTMEDSHLISTSLVEVIDNFGEALIVGGCIEYRGPCNMAMYSEGYLGISGEFELKCDVREAVRINGGTFEIYGGLLSNTREDGIAILTTYNSNKNSKVYINGGTLYRKRRAEKRGIAVHERWIRKM